MSSAITSFLESCSRNQLSEVVRALEHKQIDPNEADPTYRWTGLHLAARNGHIRVCQELLKRGAVIDCYDALGQTPLHRACFWDHHHVVELLINASADFTAMDNMGQTPMELAIQGHSSKTIPILRNALIHLEFQPTALKHSYDQVLRMKRNVVEKQKLEEEYLHQKKEMEKREMRAEKLRKKQNKQEMELLEEKDRLEQKVQLVQKELSKLTSPNSSFQLQDRNKKEKKLLDKLAKYQSQIEKKDCKIASARRSSLENSETKTKGEAWIEYINS